MGRTFQSIRQGVNEIADRWAKSARSLRINDQPHGQLLVQMAKQNSSEAFFGCDDPLEAATFSALVEIIKRLDKIESEMKKDETRQGY